ncbi:MAG: hypothetical protein IJ757_06190 [Clostridiales bacterium]|nr:hypothetical protein [Clostridiales bacterium]
MKLFLKDKTFDFHVDAPPSKSVYHRELIIRFLLGYEDDLMPSPEDSKDIIATKNCLLALREKKTILDCNESGSTLRFMIPVAAAYAKVNNISGKLVFTTKGRLYDRPIDALEKCLATHNVKIVRNDNERTFELQGNLTEGEFVIDGSASSQYVSGLMMALTILPQSTLTVTGKPTSVHYIKLTENILNKYKLDDKQNLQGFNIEGDWSGGAFLLCLSELIHGHVEVGNLNKDSVQGDKEILKFLDKLGAEELSWDCENIPDIVPYMAVTAAFRNKKTVFNNIGRLRIKESDRVAAIREQLQVAGIRTEETEDTLTVCGYENNYNSDTIELKSYNDHRMVMSAILIAAALECDLIIDSIDPVDKSFPGLRDVIREEFS